MSWHIISLKFSNGNVIFFGQKKPINVQFFGFLATLMKVHPIPRAIFETKRSGFVQILHHCSVSLKVTPLYFLWLKLHIVWTKIAHQSEIFKLLSGWVKIRQIPHVILETTSQFFFKLCITLHCHERQVFCTFLAETLYDFCKRSTPKCKISEFRLLRSNFTKFVLR